MPAAQVLTQGREIPLLPLEDKFQVLRVRPIAGAATSPTTLGAGIANVGTLVARSISNADWLSAQARIGYVSAAGAGSLCGSRDNVALLHWRGDASNRGGFVTWQQIGILTSVANERFFCGLLGSTSAPTDVDPSTLTDMIGLAADGADANLQLMHNDSAGTATRIPLGASFPKTAGTYALRLFCEMGGASIQYQVTRLDAIVTPAQGTISANIPSDVTFLGRAWWASNNTTASSIAVDYLSATSGIPLVAM